MLSIKRRPFCSGPNVLTPAIKGSSENKVICFWPANYLLTAVDVKFV